MFFHRLRAEYTDGIIDLIPLHTAPPDRGLGFGHEQIWRVALHGRHGEIGQISYRDGESRCVYYYGHIGYHIDEPFRGHHYAWRACRLIEPAIRISGKNSAVITCDPDNEASRRTCLKLGCLFERIADVPEDIYNKYEISREKCRYIWHIAAEKEP